MPTTTELIDEMLDLGEGISANTGSYVRPRAKAKKNLQRAADFTWTFRNWAFRLQRSIGEVEFDEHSRAFYALPADFLSFGRDCGLAVQIDANNWRPLVPMPMRDYLRLKANPNRSDIPAYYALGAISGVRQVFLYPTPPATMPIAANYVRKGPVCEDGDGDELILIPEQWHRPVVYERAVYFQMKDKGNTQGAALQKEIMVEGLRNMMVEEKTGREAPTQIIPYGAGWGGLPR